MMYWREITVAGGESDPFGLVYFPRMLAWFNDTEHELFRTLGHPIDKMIKEDRTTFVIAHRFSTVVAADVIVVMDGGRVLAQGQHEELMRTCPVYQGLYETQLVKA